MAIKKWLFSVFAIAFTIASVDSFPAHSEGIGPTSGTCGNNMEWSLEDGILTITGQGEMTNFTSDVGAPWETRKSQITEILIGKGITSVGSYAFYNCNNLRTVTLPDTLKVLNNCSFASSGIGQIELPDGLETIGDSAFNNSSLTSIEIPDTVTSLGQHVFAETHVLTSVKLSASITTIPYGTFVFSYSLSSIQIPDGVTSIGQSAFSYCRSLQSIDLPDTITTIASSSFVDCNALQEVHYAGTQKLFSTIVIGSSNLPLTTATWTYKPDIGMLNVLLLPSNLELIEPNAFEGVSCEAIVVPDGCVSIGSRAFANCLHLVYIRIPPETEIAIDAFDGCPENIWFERK